MKVNKLIVHCSATPEGREVTIQEIDQWHKQRGWKGCGYHYIIYLDGTVKKGRKDTEIGAHCSGHNSTSLGICYIGGFAKDGKTPKDTRTIDQKQALEALLISLKKKYPQATIHGHREFANKACPCFDAKYEYKAL